MKKSYLIFFIAFLIISVPLFLFPLNLFPGEVVLLTGNKNNPEQIVDAQLSLSYFVGLGYNSEDMVGVKSFYLTTKGYFLVFAFLIGFPFLIAYRSYLKKN